MSADNVLLLLEAHLMVHVCNDAHLLLSSSALFILHGFFEKKEKLIVFQESETQ